MDASWFDALLKVRLEKTRAVLGSKAQEYATSADRLHNFKAGAEFAGAPALACWGYMSKHLTSVKDLATGTRPVTFEMIDEKIGDAINRAVAPTRPIGRRGNGMRKAASLLPGLFLLTMWAALTGAGVLAVLAIENGNLTEDRARVELLRVRHDQALSAILSSPPSPARKELESVLYELDREHNAILARRPALKYYPLHKGTMSK